MNNLKIIFCSVSRGKTWTIHFEKTKNSSNHHCTGYGGIKDLKDYLDKNFNTPENIERNIPIINYSEVSDFSLILNSEIKECVLEITSIPASLRTNQISINEYVTSLKNHNSNSVTYYML